MRLTRRRRHISSLTSTVTSSQLKIPEDDSIPENTDDKPGQAHATTAIDAGDLANEPETVNSAPQASIETREDNLILPAIPEI